MIKAIIFDCFGVLATDEWLPFKHEHFGSDPERFREATDLIMQASAGLISYRQFVDRIAEMSGVDSATVSKSLHTNSPNTPLFAEVSRLKGEYRLGILSNAASDWLGDMFSKDQLALFDEVVLSYRVGLAKPDERIFRLTAERLNAEPSECLFVDDQEGYCAAARDLGMKTIVYQDYDQFKRELDTVLTEAG